MFVAIPSVVFLKFTISNTPWQIGLYGSRFSKMDQVKFVEDSLKSIGSNMICLGRPYHFQYFKGCLPQTLLHLFLNTLSHMYIYKTSIYPSCHICFSTLLLYYYNYNLLCYLSISTHPTNTVFRNIEHLLYYMWYLNVCSENCKCLY